MKTIGLAFVLASAVPALAGHSAPPPTDLTTVKIGTAELTLGPFITDNYLPAGLPGDPGRSDPVNLVFLDTDPRAIRQQLMTLSGPRGSKWDFLPSGANGCVWMDGMGYEQAAYVEPEGWVGGIVQLACATPSSPLGREYRFHVRLFRSGEHTVGGAHFEINTPGTAEHTVLSWEMAREFVVDEMARLSPGAFQGDADLFAPVDDAFREVDGRVNYYVFATNNPLHQRLGLAPPSAGLPSVKIPASGKAAAFAPGFEYVPVKSDTTLTDSRTYAVASTPKPLCGGEDIQITGGPLTFTLRVQTNASGKYQRTYTAGGTLDVKTLSTGVEQDAVIAQFHRGVLTDKHAQVTQADSQVLLPSATAEGQSGFVFFGAGQNDYWKVLQNCAID